MPTSPFDLLLPLAAGGHSEVWSGRHRRSGRAVAIKVLTTKEARKPGAQETFRAEVRAAAGLDHPAVAWVLDYGLLPESWAEKSEGRLTTGSPYLVSEQARGGDLRRWIRSPPTWKVLRSALLSLLDALGFAHARGVIHRDLKPANVLLATRREERHGVLLADFGIAHRLGTMPERGFYARAGTPTYMAPEQIAGHWRAYGPWTDLYALGVLTWSIVQGEAPIRGDLSDGGAQLVAWRPPRVDTPTGLPGWVARLLRDDPRERFLRASDAATALIELDDSDVGGVFWESRVIDNDTVSTGPTRRSESDNTVHHLIGTASNRTLSGADDVFPLRLGIEAMAVPPLQIPADWRPRRQIPPPLALVDAGLGLHGLRDRPLIGREEERDRMWARARRAAEEGRCGVVMLNGPLGVGKSRLLRWFCERAEETGLALAAFGRVGEGTDAGLIPMLRRTLRLEGLRGQDLEAAISSAPLCAPLSREDVRSLVSLLEEEARVAQRAPLSAGESNGMILRLLRHAAAHRALVIALDDAADDAEALGLVEHLLRQDRDASGAVIIVIAARDETLAARPALQARWLALAQRPEVEPIALGPLPKRDWANLANAGLHLRPALRDAVAARCAGNPLFTELLVGDWVRRDALVVCADGFDLDGAIGDLPESVTSLVSGLLDALVRYRSESDVRALELAAVLGLDVKAVEWRIACRVAGIEAAPDLVDACLNRRLLRPGAHDGDFGFAQTMVREALIDRAAQGGRLAVHHQAAAAALASESGPSWEHSGRRGRHLLSAGRPVEATEPLLTAALGASLTGRHAEERAALDLVERALPSLPAGHQDLVAARMWSLRGHAQQFGQGDRAEARACYLTAIEAAERAGKPALVLDTRRRLGGVTFELGDVGSALRILEETLAQARTIGDAFVQSLTALDLCTVMRMAGKRAEAEAIGRFSRQVAEEAGLEDLVAINSKHSWYLETLPDEDARVEALKVAIKSLEALNIPGHRGAALNVLGGKLRERGDLDGALSCFRESFRTYDEIGGSLATLPRYNIAMVLLDQDQMWDAYPILKRCLQDATTHGLAFFEPMVRSALADIELNVGDLEAFDVHITRVRALWEGGGTPEQEAAANLERVVATAKGLDLSPQAHAAAALASDLYEAACLPAAAARARALVDNISIPGTTIAQRASCQA